MNLICISTAEYPRSLWQVRQGHPNVSFPAEPTDKDLAPYDHANVHPTPQPDYDQRTQRLEEDTPALVGNRYEQAWRLRDATAEEIADWDRTHAPAPEWRGFAVSLILLPEVSVFLSSLPSAPARALEVALAQVANGAGADLLIELLRGIPMPPELAVGIGQLAAQHHLPPELISALSSLDRA